MIRRATSLYRRFRTGSRVLDLKTLTVKTLPIEARSNIRCLALSPDNALLVVVDVQNYALLINFTRGVVLHRWYFKRKVRAVEFSPNGRHLAVSYGKHIQVWCMPSSHSRKEFAPLTLHRTYTGQSDDVTCISWLSLDGSVLAAGSRDGTVRIWTLHSTKNYEPVTLSGHKRGIVGTYLISAAPPPAATTTEHRLTHCYSISEDGALVTWECTYPQQEGDEGAEMKVQGDDDDPMQHEIDDGDEALNFFTGGGATANELPSASFTTHGMGHHHRQPVNS